MGAVRKLPGFNLPEVVGVAMSPQELALVVQHSVEEIARSLDCARLIVLTYSAQDRLLRAVTSVGVEIASLHELRFSLSEFVSAEQAIRTRQIRVVTEGGQTLPEPFRSLLRGDVAIVPLMLGERVMSVLVGQVAPEASPRSAQWQERAEEIAARGALMAELARVSSAYQEERRLRQAAQGIIAAILEGRPLSEVAELITANVAERLCVERVGLYLFDGSGGYRPASLRNISAEYGEDIKRLRRQSPFSARAIATHLPYFTPDAQTDPQVSPELRAIYQREGITSLLIAVLHQGDSIKGALVVYPESSRRFSPAEMNLFQAFSDQATLAVAIAWQLEQQRETATAQERDRLAREMHDTVAQSLAAVVLQVETAETYLSQGQYETVRSLLESAHIQSRKALEDTRRAVQGLAPPNLEGRSTARALAEEVRQFGEDMNLDAPFIVTGDEQPLSPEQRLALLRIAQEALNNARKHAQAQRVRVGLQFGPESVVLIVEDDGVGYDTTARSTPDSSGGYGLFGMNERARLLGGEVQIESAPGWGTRLRASLPYRPARETTESRKPETATFSGRLLPNPSLREAGSGQNSASPSALRILIADDHAIVRQGLRDVLEADGSLRVVAEAENGAQAVEQAKRYTPDVVLMDLQMPEVDGLEGLRRLRVVLPALPVVVLTTFENEESVAEALASGARGYLLKDAAPGELIAAIQAAYRGESQFSASITERLASLASGQTGRAAGINLNEREREVLGLLAEGARNKEIAASLFISVSTVEKHIAGLFTKLGVSSRAEAVRVAAARGLIPRPPFPGK